MSETKPATLDNLSETYLAPLYWKALESLRPDAMIKDEKAVALVTQMGFDFSGVRQIKMNELLQAMRIIFTREMERYIRDFLNRHPEVGVVHIGCGLDSRFERVDNGRVEWYDLDLPEVIALGATFRLPSGQAVSACLMNGISSINLNHGWPLFVGWRLSSACSGQCASSTSNLERYQGDISIY